MSRYLWFHTSPLKQNSFCGSSPYIAAGLRVSQQPNSETRAVYVEDFLPAFCSCRGQPCFQPELYHPPSAAPPCLGTPPAALQEGGRARTCLSAEEDYTARRVNTHTRAPGHTSSCPTPWEAAGRSSSAGIGSRVLVWVEQMVGRLTGSKPETESERTAGVEGVVVSTVLAWC